MTHCSESTGISLRHGPEPRPFADGKGGSLTVALPTRSVIKVALVRIKDVVLSQHWITPTIVTVVSALGLNQVEWAFRHANTASLPSGYLLQEWSSESMMQTLALKDMFAFGPMALVYDHVYPPLEDAIRYAVSLPDLVHQMPPNYGAVDLHLYLIYAWCYGLTNAVIFLWVRDVTRNVWWAIFATLLWALSPAFLTNMTLLDPTPLAMVTVTWAFYFLYRFLRTRSLKYVSGFLLAVLLGSLSRSITQPHVLVFLLFFVATAWWISRKRYWWLQVINVVLALFLFIVPIKQQVLFGTIDTTTFSGYHHVGMIQLDPTTLPNIDFPKDILGNGDRFPSKYNTSDTIRDNYRLTQGANHALITNPIGSVNGALRSLALTIPEALRAGSQYVDNKLVARLPWRSIYDWVFSGWRYALIVIMAAALLWIQRGNRGMLRWISRYGWFLAFYLLIAIPVFWSNSYIPLRESEGPIWTDAIRLKMFLEVPLVVLLAYGLWNLPTIVKRMRLSRASS